MRLFIDSGPLIARHSKNDTNHEKAVKTFQKILDGEIPVTRMYTSDYVLSEAMTVALIRASHKTAIELGEAILASRAFEILRVEKETFDEAWEIFKTYKDQNFSFADCTSFALMKKKDIRHAFAFDSHFETAGFVRI